MTNQEGLAPPFKMKGLGRTLAQDAVPAGPGLEGRWLSESLS